VLQAEGRAMLADCVRASSGDVLRCGSHPCDSAPQAAFVRKGSFAMYGPYSQELQQPEIDCS